MSSPIQELRIALGECRDCIWAKKAQAEGLIGDFHHQEGFLNGEGKWDETGCRNVYYAYLDAWAEEVERERGPTGLSRPDVESEIEARGKARNHM